MSEDETTMYNIGQRSCFQNYSPVDKENTEERNITRFSGEAENNLAVQLSKIPFGGEECTRGL